MTWLKAAARAVRAVAACGMAAALAAAPLAQRATAFGAPVSTIPTLPQLLGDPPAIAPSGRVIRIGSTGPTLQDALDRARAGDAIELAPGSVHVGNFVLRAGTRGWIVVRTEGADARMPPGVRVSPASAPKMAKIVSPNARPAIRTEPGASRVRLVGLEVTIADGVRANDGVVVFGSGSQSSLGDVPRDLVVERCYVHGTPRADVRRGLALNSARTWVLDSHVSEIHARDYDSQAVCGWNGPGPFKIENNHLEAAGENILFGGADPRIRDLVPSDVEVRGNYLVKPLAWRDGPVRWSVKNLFELKNARRVLVEGNVMENCWPAAQRGFAVLLTVRNQDGMAPWSVVEDVTLRNNVVRRAGAGINILGSDDRAPSMRSARITIEENLFEEIGAFDGRGVLVQISAADDVAVQRNTAAHSGPAVMAHGAPSRRFVFAGNATAKPVVAGDGDDRGVIERCFPEGLVDVRTSAGADRARLTVVERSATTGSRSH